MEYSDANRLKKNVGNGPVILKTKKAKHIKALQNEKNVLNCLIAYNKYGGYCTPISSQQRVAVQEILKGKVYEPDTIQFIIENCHSGDVVHAGTFFGDFLPGISSGLSENAKIWAFEPNYESYKCAQITLIINDLGNIVLKNAGLGEAKSKKKMLIRSAVGVSLGGGSRIVNYAAKGEAIEIDIVSIDMSIPKERNISIIQLDVEGYEKEALKGALNTIRRWRPILILEDNKNIIMTDWFIDNIISIGYEVFGKVHNNIILKTTAVEK